MWQLVSRGPRFAVGASFGFEGFTGAGDITGGLLNLYSPTSYGIDTSLHAALGLWKLTLDGASGHQFMENDGGTRYAATAMFQIDKAGWGYQLVPQLTLEHVSTTWMNADVVRDVVLFDLLIVLPW
jgi:hypothetical protein